MWWRLVRLVRRLVPLLDVLLCVFTLPAALLLKFVRWAGVERMPRSRNALLRAGVFPIRDHYYEPRFDFRDVRGLGEPRALPGIDWNEEGQLALLASLGFAGEIRAEFPKWFPFANPSFDAGDAEFWYGFLRHRKPGRVVEVGGGVSTRVAHRALQLNGQPCEHVCIEPYEAPWLEALGVRVIRQKVEDVPMEVFDALEPGDVLFIDSSHVIRPRGDVVHEMLEILPRLAPGVAVHFHDVFSPRDYPAQWLREQVLLWNEQYLLEAFLTNNHRFRILAALNYLHHAHPEALRAQCPYLTPQHEPASFYVETLPLS